MSKQNRANPKYILLASPSQQLREISSSSLHSKSHLTLPTQYNKYDSFKAKIPKDTMASFNKDAQKDVESIRKDITDCVNNIVAQQKKNKIYKELIDVLQAEMKKLEQEQKQMNKIENEQNLKKIHKVQYDMEQILQKHNEEVARINNLKEQVSSARSDRVVFSNLFKKIEKEIKQSEEHYTTIIAKTETSRQQLHEKQLAEQSIIKEQSVDQFELKDDYRELSNKTTRRQNFIFLTNPNNLGYPSKKPSNQPSFQSPQPKSPSSKELSFLIEQTETRIQKIFKLVECSSCEQAQQFYGGLEGQNSRLSQLIWDEDKKIQQLQEEIERLRLQKRISQIYQSKHISKLQHLSSNRKIRSIRHIHTAITQSTERQDQNIEIICSALSILGIAHSEDEAEMMNDSDILQQLQRKMDDLSKHQFIKKSDSNLTLSNIYEQNLDTILTKMQKFQNCDRIFNKAQFCSQYTKQVSKNKRIKAKK